MNISCQWKGATYSILLDFVVQMQLCILICLVVCFPNKLSLQDVINVIIHGQYSWFLYISPYFDNKLRSM